MSEQIFNQQEIEEMFNVSFLPMIHEFSKRTKEKRAEDDIKMFRIFLDFNFIPQEKTLQFSDIEKAVNMQLQPITQEDIDEWEKIQNSKINASQSSEENVEVPFEKV